jgi:predicted acylesterase/phospholipase RssA
MGGLVAAAVAWIAVSGCYRVNPPLERPFSDAGGYRFTNLGDQASQDAADETFVVLTFSGGGTRAAAFAYGALEALRATDLGDGRTLLDEVDVISSVSGGSFAAAYYGLFGREEFFARFREQVLYRPIERDIILRLLAPWNWPRLLSPYFARSDLAAEYYDGAIFGHRTFAAMPLRRPFIILNATDIGRGAQFSFTQDHFDRICSNLNGVPVGRGVTASSAFPVAFTPLTLQNYGAGACGYDPPRWVVRAEHGDFDANPQRFDLARTWRSYEDASRRPYIHLSDGGLADNIGLRAVETRIWSTGSIPVIDQVNNGAIKRLVIIVVDAKPRIEAPADRSARPPGIFTVLEAAATNPMENYSSDTVERIRLAFDEWDNEAAHFEQRRAGCRQLAAASCTGGGTRRAQCETAATARCDAALAAEARMRPKKPELYLIHVRFDAIPDESAKRSLQHVDTRLQLPREQVDLLVTWGRRLLADAAAYRRLVDSLDGTMPQ